MADKNEITALLAEAQAGHRDAVDQLVPVLYAELRNLAHNKLFYERRNHTLNTTALVSEAYLSLVDQTRASWQSRAHFLAAAAASMRHILLHYAEARRALKRGGDVEKVSVDALGGDVADNGAPTNNLGVHAEITDDRAEELIALDDTVKQLASFDPESAQIVEYRFFGGLSQVEIAEVMGSSERTVRRKWLRAKAWIRKEMESDNDS